MCKQIDLLMCASIRRTPGGILMQMQDVSTSLNAHGFKVRLLLNSPLENRLPGLIRKWVSTYLITAKIIFKLLSGYKIMAVEIHEPGAYFYCILRRIFRFLPLCYVKSYGVAESVFEICSLYMNFSLKTRILQRLRNFLSFIALKYADMNILESLKDKYFLEQRYKVFHNILTGSSISPALSLKLKRESHNSINVAFVGSWIDIKGAGVIKRIIPKVLSESNNIHFYLLGTGADNLKKIDEELGRYKHRIIVVGQYDHFELSNYLNRCDILLCPSIYDTGPHAILEGLYFKLAVICSKNCFIYTLREALERQDAIISIAPDDTTVYVDNILILAKDEAKRARLADKGHQIVKQLTWDELLANYIKELENGIKK